VAGQRGDRTDVVEVRVGDEDRLDVEVELVDWAGEPVGLVAGIDQQALRPRAVAAHEERVLLHRADVSMRTSISAWPVSARRAGGGCKTQRSVA
jgi:hypothetical protein